jgi:hypothetical protein
MAEMFAKIGMILVPTGRIGWSELGLGVINLLEIDETNERHCYQADDTDNDVPWPSTDKQAECKEEGLKLFLTHFGAQLHIVEEILNASDF